MKFYVDECLSPAIADAISQRRSHRAVHSARDLSFGGRPDEFHIAESRRRREVLITSNHRDFVRGFEVLRQHPEMVVFNTGAWTKTDQELTGIDMMFSIFRVYRIGAKPPFRNDLHERLALSSQVGYLEDVRGYRFDIYPTADSEWRPSRASTSARDLF